ncbi:MAG: hypothetical protein ACYDIC_14605 [Desulfobaccales bacterium]
MKSKFLVISLALCFFWLQVCLLPAAYGATRLDLVVGYGVDNHSEAQARLALDTATNFFQNTYGLGLERDLQIFLVPDQDAYRTALIQRYNLSDNQARNVAESTAGFSRGSAGATIVVNMGNLRSGLSQLFCLCHELVHQFQSQESRDRHNSIRWLSEGVAEALAAHILETAGLKKADYKGYWQGIVKKAPRFPRLENLHSYNEWFASMEANGSQVTYGTAALAVLTLVQWKGYRPLFAYFTSLQQLSPEAAFVQAFGATVADFEKQFTPF